jgi:high-affinity Fe2+/Pb2+ permease
MIYGTLRASTFSITVLTLAFPKLQLKANAVVAGLTTAMGAGFPVFLYGNLNNLADVKLYGSLFTATIAGIVAYAITQVITSNNSKKKELVK